jgi:uncharacterized protein YndB with AHSA1/START domain
MHIESHIDIARPPKEVFDYLADAESLPEYAADFDSVERTRGSGPGPDAVYTYKMRRGVEGTFRHTVFRPHSKLVWQGPAARSGPGTMAPAGSWELREIDGGTRVTLTMSPVPGGLLRIMAPMLAASIRKTLPTALLLLKRRLEHQPSLDSNAIGAAQ